MAKRKKMGKSRAVRVPDHGSNGGAGGSSITSPPGKGGAKHPLNVPDFGSSSGIGNIKGGGGPAQNMAGAGGAVGNMPGGKKMGRMGYMMSDGW